MPIDALGDTPQWVFDTQASWGPYYKSQSAPPYDPGADVYQLVLRVNGALRSMQHQDDHDFTNHVWILKYAVPLAPLLEHMQHHTDLPYPISLTSSFAEVVTRAALQHHWNFEGVDTLTDAIRYHWYGSMLGNTNPKHDDYLRALCTSNAEFWDIALQQASPHEIHGWLQPLLCYPPFLPGPACVTELVAGYEYRTDSPLLKSMYPQWYADAMATIDMYANLMGPVKAEDRLERAQMVLATIQESIAAPLSIDIPIAEHSS